MNDEFKIKLLFELRNYISYLDHEGFIDILNNAIEIKKRKNTINTMSFIKIFVLNNDRHVEICEYTSSVSWFRDNVYHRDDGLPALMFLNGKKYYFENGNSVDEKG